MEKLTKQAAEMIIKELMKDENKRKLESHVLDPSAKYIGERIWPYIFAFAIFLSTILMMSTYIIYTTQKLYKFAK
jgi:hypothetical protein